MEIAAPPSSPRSHDNSQKIKKRNMWKTRIVYVLKGYGIKNCKEVTVPVRYPNKMCYNVWNIVSKKPRWTYWKVYNNNNS